MSSRRNLPGKEKLPPGFWRTPSGSLRVQIRINGHPTEVKSFPIFEDSPAARARQTEEAKLWDARTRNAMLAGTHVSTKAAETMTLGDALSEYGAKGLKGSEKNKYKDLARIQQILADPISGRAVAALRDTDLSKFVDRLIMEFVERDIAGKLAKLAGERSKASLPGRQGAKSFQTLGERISRLKSVDGLRKRIDEPALSLTDRNRASDELHRVIAVEKVRSPARTTIANTVQLISRALKYQRGRIDGVPSLNAPANLPSASPGRTRRPAPEEFAFLLDLASGFDPRLPLLIRFAVKTALRRERILQFRLDYIRDIGKGRQAIVFPPDKTRAKKAGVVPVTNEIAAIIAEAREAGGVSGAECPLFDINSLTLDTWWKRLLKRASIKDLHFHDLRHEATSQLFEQGLTTAEVMSITGHSTTEMVDRYSHYSARLVLEKLEKGLEPKKLLGEIEFLADQYLACGGVPHELAVALGKHLVPQGASTQ